MYFFVENNIIKTEDENLNAEIHGGLGNIYFKFLKLHGNKIAQIEHSTGKTDTFGSLLQRIIRTAIGLKKKGIRKGDIVLSCSNNHLDDCIPVIASYFLGAIPCSLDPIYTLSEVTRLLERVKPKIVFTIPERLQIINNAVEKLNFNVEIVVFGTSAHHIEFQTFCQEQEGETEFKPVIITNPKETATIFFSSGSSGLPKGICLNHYYFIRQSSLVRPGKIENLDEERKIFEESKLQNEFSFLTYSPLCWITGGNTLFNTILTGICRVIVARFDPKEFWQITEKYKVVLTFLTSFQITELVRCGKPQEANPDKLIRIYTGGASLSRTYVLALQKLLPQTDIIQSYALTETGFLAQFETYNKFHREYYKNVAGAVGFPLRGVSYKVVDLETEEILGPNKEGELRVKTDCIMNGYYNQDFQDQFDEDGWFKTGDIVKYDENYCFYVIDRVKEVIKYRSIPVQPTILERELLKHPSVKQAVVIGKPHEEDGEHPMAVIILNENCQDTTAEEIQKYIDERVLDKEKLRGGVKFVDSVPMSTSDKVKRRQLKNIILGGKL